jgi:hypothetical protein
MRSRLVQLGRDAVRKHVPGAAHARRAYLNWAYSRRPAARAKLFQTFAQENRWGDPDTISGPGSNLEQTQVIREELPKLWVELNIRRLADIPCGDLYWMSMIVDRLDYYFGGDIAPEAVERARGVAPAHCEFAVFDLLNDTFPTVDAILVRDAFVALSNRDVATALGNVRRSSARYLITTTFPDKLPQDIVTGGWRPLNLTAPPFSLPEPLRLINERSTLTDYFADKSLGVWEIGQLPDRFAL